MINITENSLYKTQTERDALFANKEALAVHFLYNFVGVLGLYDGASQNGIARFKQYFAKDGQLQLANIGEKNNDMSIVVKLASEDGYFRSPNTVNEITRFLVKLKAGQIDKVDSQIIRNWLHQIIPQKFQNQLPSRIKKAVVDFIGDGKTGTNLEDLSYKLRTYKRLYNISPEYYSLSAIKQKKDTNANTANPVVVSIANTAPSIVTAPTAAQPTLQHVHAHINSLSYYKKSKLKQAAQAAGTNIHAHVMQQMTAGAIPFGAAAAPVPSQAAASPAVVTPSPTPAAPPDPYADVPTVPKVPTPDVIAAHIKSLSYYTKSKKKEAAARNNRSLEDHVKGELEYARTMAIMRHEAAVKAEREHQARIKAAEEEKARLLASGIKFADNFRDFYNNDYNTEVGTDTSYEKKYLLATGKSADMNQRIVYSLLPVNIQAWTRVAAAFKPRASVPWGSHYNVANYTDSNVITSPAMYELFDEIMNGKYADIIDPVAFVFNSNFSNFQYPFKSYLQNLSIQEATDLLVKLELEKPASNRYSDVPYQAFQEAFRGQKSGQKDAFSAMLVSVYNALPADKTIPSNLSTMLRYKDESSGNYIYEWIFNESKLEDFDGGPDGKLRRLYRSLQSYSGNDVLTTAVIGQMISLLTSKYSGNAIVRFANDLTPDSYDGFQSEMGYAIFVRLHIVDPITTLSNTFVKLFARAALRNAYSDYNRNSYSKSLKEVIFPEVIKQISDPAVRTTLKVQTLTNSEQMKTVEAEDVDAVSDMLYDMHLQDGFESFHVQTLMRGLAQHPDESVGGEIIGRVFWKAIDNQKTNNRTVSGKDLTRLLDCGALAKVSEGGPDKLLKAIVDGKIPQMHPNTIKDYIIGKQEGSDMGNFIGDLVLDTVDHDPAAVNKLYDQIDSPYFINKIRSRVIGFNQLINSVNNGEIKPFGNIDSKRMKKVLEFNNLDIEEIEKKLKVKKSKSETFSAYLKRAADVSKNINVLSPIAVVDDKLDEGAVNDFNIELVSKHFAGRHGNIYPLINKVFSVHLPDDEFQAFKKLMASKNDLQQIEPCFHGTGGIAAGMILRYGFKVLPANAAGVVGRMLGDGIYFSNKIDKALQYVGNDGYGRNWGTKGYIFYMENVLGKKHEDYSAAGLEGQGGSIRSPEWCVRDARKQLKIVKAAEVTLVSEQTYNKMRDARKKALGESVENNKKLSFKDYIAEVNIPGSGIKNQVIYIFHRGLVPIPDPHTGDLSNAVESSEALAHLPPGVTIEETSRGPAVVFHDTSFHELNDVLQIAQMPLKYEKQYIKLWTRHLK